MTLELLYGSQRDRVDVYDLVVLFNANSYGWGVARVVGMKLHSAKTEAAALPTGAADKNTSAPSTAIVSSG